MHLQFQGHRWKNRFWRPASPPRNIGMYAATMDWVGGAVWMRWSLWSEAPACSQFGCNRNHQTPSSLQQLTFKLFHKTLTRHQWVRHGGGNTSGFLSLKDVLGIGLIKGPRVTLTHSRFCVATGCHAVSVTKCPPCDASRPCHDEAGPPRGFRR